MSEHQCVKEKQWGTVETTISYTKDALARIETKICKHVDEGEKQGGFRDRIIILEGKVNSIWWVVIIFSTIGGMLGKLAPDLVNFIIKIAWAGQ